MQVEAERGSWRVEGLPLRIDYSTAVLEEICAQAVEGLSRLRRGGVEVGGLLFGIRHGPYLQIQAYRPVRCEHARGPSFSLSDQDLAGLEELLAAARQDPALRDLEPVGWYHSHTRSEVCLSPEDLELHGRYFPDPWQVALVVRPAQFGPCRVGFFFREQDGSIRADASYLEFSVRPRRHRAPPVPPEPGPDRPPVPAPAGATPAPSAPEPSPPVPAFALVEPPRSRKRLWLAALLVAALAAAGYAAWSLWPRPSASAFSLRVLDLDGQLIVEWDRASPPVQRARRATFEILDGAERQVVSMEGDRLREGSLTYARRSEKVDVRCRIEGPGTPVEEFIRFLGQPPPARPAPDQAETLRQRDDLQQQVERLRAELALKNAQMRRLQQRPRPATQQPAAERPAAEPPATKPAAPPPTAVK